MPETAIDFQPDGAEIDFQPESEAIDFQPEQPDPLEGRRLELQATLGRGPVAPIGNAPSPTFPTSDFEPSGVGLETPPELQTILRGPQVGRHAWEAINKPLAPLSRLAPSAQTVQDALQALSSASPELTEQESEAVLARPGGPDALSKVIAGAEQSALGTGESLTTPFNLATLGTAALPKLVGRLVSGLFSLDMASHFPALYAELKAAVNSGDEQRITKAVGDIAATGALTGATAKHAATRTPTPHDLAVKSGAEMLNEATAQPLPEIDFVPAEPIERFAEPPERVGVSPSMLADLQAAMKGNQLRPQKEVTRQVAPPVAEPAPAPTGAETITGPDALKEALGNERTGSEIPAEREERLPQSVPKRRTAEERPHDIIDELLGGVGKIDPFLIREANPDWRPTGAARELFKRGGIPADSALDAITREGGKLGLDADTPMDEFGEAINAAARARIEGRRRASAERAALDKEAAEASREGLAKQQFDAAAVEGQRPKSDRTGTEQVPVDSFVVGDRFKVRDQTFKVTDLEVDEDGNLLSVTVEDGPKFGVQKVEGRDVIHIDDGTMRRNRQARAKAVEFLPEEPQEQYAKGIRSDEGPPDQTRGVTQEGQAGGRGNVEQAPPGQPKPVEPGAATEPFALNAPESVEQQQRRQQAEAETAQRKAQREEVERRAAAPLEGKQGDIGQGDLLGGGDLFSVKAPTADRVEQFLDSLKSDVKPGELHAFGIVPELWNGFVETVRLAYRGGKSIKRAIDEGIAWLRERHQGAIDEAAIRQHMDDMLRGFTESPEAIADRAADLRRQVREYRARGEEPPAELRQRAQVAEEEFWAQVEERRQGTEQPREQGQGGAGRPTNQPQPQPARPVPRYTGPERLPRGRLRDMFSSLTELRHGMADWWARGDLKKDITIRRDAADNRAALAANEAANQVRLQLNRAFGETGRDVIKKRELREYALSFVVESDGDRGKLAEWHALISDSDFGDTRAGRRALKAIELADSQWDRFAQAAATYKEITTAERESELSAGVNSGEWEGGYVYHRWKKNPAGGGVDPNAPAAAPSPFRKPRTVPTYAEGIAAGGVPHTLNGIELLASRVGDGQRVLNELSWIEGMRRMQDPVTGEPLVTDVIRRPRRRPGQGEAEPETEAEAAAAWDQAGRPDWITTAPPGYEVIKFGPVEFALKQGYGGLFSDLTAKSWLEGGEARRIAKRAFGFSKSVLLMADTFHLGRLAMWKTVLTGTPSFRKGATLLDYSEADIREMVRNGELPREWEEDLLENRRKLAMAVDTGFNVGQILDNAASDWLHNIPGLGQFNKWLFGQYQRGAMADAWLVEFERTRNMFPAQSEREVARYVSRDLNARFGNLGRQGLIRSKTGQDLARLVFLAPQWNESLIRSELGAVGQAVRAPYDSIKQKRLVAGTLLRATGTMALGTFLANQILNYAFRGKPTWENEEEGWESKISAWIPDVVGNGPGMMLNPLALPAEYTHLISSQLHRSKDTADAAWRIVNSRLSSPSRALLMLATRRDALGRTLKPGDVLPAMGEALVPLPLPASSIGAAAKQVATGEPSEKYPGQFQKQVLSTFGVKTDQAPSDEQRVRSLAREFNSDKGITPSAEFYAGDYDDLTRALRIGNQSDAEEAMQELLVKKTRKQIVDHFTRWVRAPYTGQIRREGEFLRSLTPEQREAYVRSREKRRQLMRDALELLRATNPVR